MGNLVWHAEIDAEQIKKDIRQINQRMKTFTKDVKTQGSQVDSTFKRIGAAMAGYFSITAAKGFLDQVIQVRGEFQQLDIALQTMLQSKSKADKLMSEVVEMAAKTPFSLTELGQGAKRLLAFKEPADQVTESLRRLGDLAAGASVPVTDLIQAYGKVSAKGKMQAEELNQFAERGIPIISELAKVVGATDKEIYKMAEQGKIGFEELQAAIKNMTDEGGQFFNLMEKQSGSLTGQVSNLGDAWDRMLNEVGESNEGMIYAGIGGLKTLVENYETIIDTLKVLIATYGAYRAALAIGAIARNSANVLESVRVWGSLVKQIRTARDAQAAFNLVTKANPWGLLAGAVAGLVTYLAVFNTETNEAAEGVERLADVTGEVNTKIEHENRMLDMYKRKLAEAKPGSERRVELVKELNQKYPDLLKNIDAENTSISTLQSTIDEYGKSLEKTIKLKVLENELSGILTESQNIEQQYREGEIDSNERYNQQQRLEKRRDLLFEELEYQKDLVDYGKEVADLMKQRRELQKELAEYESFGSIAMQLPETKEGYEKAKKDIEAINKQIEDIISGGSEDGGGEKTGLFDIKAFEKQLSEQKKAYENYNDALRSARDEDKEAVKNYYSELLKQGEDYEQYLIKQLEAFRNNVSAKVAIYQAATAENIDLTGKGITTTLKGKGVKGVKTSFNVDTKSLKDVDGILSRIQLKLQKIAEDDTAQMGEGFMDVAYMLQDVSRNVGEFDEGLGRALGTMADLAGYSGQLIANLGSGGNWTMAVSGIVGVATTLVGLFSNAKSKQEAAARAAENFRRQLELQNRALERQIELMNEASGEDRFKAESDSLELINRQIEDLNRRADELDIRVTAEMAGSELDEKLFDIENVDELINALERSEDVRSAIEKLNKYGFEVKNYDELLEIIDNYDKLIEKRRELMEDIVATTTDDIADSIIEGFRQGEKAAEAFSQSFENMMKDALLETFKKQYVMQAAGGFFDEMAALMDPKASPGLTESEIAQLQETWNNSMTQLQGQFDAFDKISKELFGSGFEDVSEMSKASEDPLTGAVKGVSEETASLIGGQMNAIRINQAESLRIMNESVRYQAQIAVNTSNNIHLVRLENIERILSSFKSNSNSDPLKAKGL